MLSSKTRWIVRDSEKETVKDLSERLNIAPLVASLLINRGINNEKMARFFLFDEGQQFHDPFLLKDMDKAVSRIKQAIAKDERILIYGDYDADGVCSTALLMKTLEHLGANVQYYIPNRFREGYGPNEMAFRQAAQIGISLIITVDTGIAAKYETEVASELGIDVIITDHHELGESLPNAYAIIHPNIAQGSYPFKKLAGVGVAFKLAHALFGDVPKHLLDLVAIGTIADLVSLTDENRFIVKRGLEKISEINRVGIQALCKVANIKLEELDEESVGFGIGPRLNAVGRLGDADLAVELLLTTNYEEALEIADEIEQLNRERQSLVKSITEEALLQAEQEVSEDKKILVVAKEGWHEGVIGIVASKLVEQFYRPVIVLSINSQEQIAKGSARSIDAFDLFQNLSDQTNLLLHYGGHPMAAGLTLKQENIDKLRVCLNNAAHTQLTNEHLIQKTELDYNVNIENINLDLIEQINLLAPFGIDNPKPKIMIKDVHIKSMRKIGTNNNHLKMTLTENEAELDIIGFNKGHLYDHISPNAKISVIGGLSINEWNNIKKPQLYLHDLAINEWQLFDIRSIKSIETITNIVPSNNRCWIIFKRETLDKINIPDKELIHYIDSNEEARNVNLTGNVILVDLPPSLEMFTELINGKKFSRIYTYFFKEDSDFFSTLPTREHFKWYYAFLRKEGSFNLKKYSNKLAKHRGWSIETIDFMSQVFAELQFITIKDGIISLAENISKRNLSESPTYQKKQAQFLLEKKLLYSSYNELKNLFDENYYIALESKEVLT